MSRGSKLVAIGDDARQSDAEVSDKVTFDEAAASDAEVISGDEPDTDWAEEDWAEDDWAEEAPEKQFGRGWLAPTLAILAIAGWTGFFGWLHHGAMLGGASALQWSEWIGSWAVPVLLVVALWILAIRNSRHEARRFAEVASSLSAESSELETRLNSVNRELSLAREFLAAQSRELDTLGRVAGDRLSKHADKLQSLVGSNSEQIESIAGVSVTALENMNKLRDDLPVIANSARDVSNQIGGAGRTAHGQLDEMISGFERLNQFGEASERQVDSMRLRIDETLEVFEKQADQLDQLLTSRFAALRNESESFGNDVEATEAEALASIRRRAAAMSEELRQTHEQLNNEEEQALASLQTRSGLLRDSIEEAGASIRTDQEAAVANWGESIKAMQDRLGKALEQISAIDEQALANANRKLQDLMEEAQTVDDKLAERAVFFDNQLTERRAQLETDEQTAITQLENQLAMLDNAIEEKRANQVEIGELLSNHSDVIVSKLAAFRSAMATMAEQGSETERLLTGNVAAISASLNESREAIAGTDEAVAELTEGSVRLLELIRGAAERAKEDLPAAIADSETRLSAMRGETEQMNSAIGDAMEKGQALSAYVISSKDDGRDAADAINALHTRLAQAGTDHAERLHSLRKSVTELGQESDAVSQRAQENLQAAIAELQTAMTASADSLTESASASIHEYSETVSSQTADAVDKALRLRTEAAISELEEHAARAANVSREATIQLRDQLAKVNELAANLEARVDRARERAEEQVDNDFSRRVALITESLNSNAIDISKGLASEVSDTAWASYLRGDRGIFTRRAVSLLDNAEARDIAEVYDEDADFRDHVSRYIHDFEAMLRAMLSTRDGNALGVTLLSSDMGKLYVALAQATERLRA